MGTDLKEIGDAVLAAVRSYVARAVASVSVRLDKLEAQLAALPAPRDGKDGRDGRDGTSVTMADVERLVAVAVAALPPAKDGTSVTMADVQPLIEKGVADFTDKALAFMEAVPKAQDGKDGKDGRDGADGTSVDVEEVMALLRLEMLSEMKALPAPKDGTDGRDGASVTLDDVRPMIEQQVAAAVAAIPAPKDGRDGVDGKSVTLDDLVPLYEAAQARWALDFERRAQDILQRAIDRVPAPKDGKDGRDGKDGADGRDGFGFDDLRVEFDGERTATLVFTKGEAEKRFPLNLRVPLYKGVYAPETKYAEGDMVTWGGSIWYCTHATTGGGDAAEKPCDTGSAHWRLATKKGRDGKDGKDGERGERGPAGRSGRGPT